MSSIDGKQARELNDVIRYTAWSVFKSGHPIPGDRMAAAQGVDELFAQLSAKDTVIRGVYDVQGLRADADFMIWWHA
ncbi:MAG: chlorite dismutase family protein, partial [Candidatus Nanopelagicales bacterium]